MSVIAESGITMAEVDNLCNSPAEGRTASGWSCVKGERGEEGSSALTLRRSIEVGEGMVTETPDLDWVRCLSPDTRGLDILSEFQSNGLDEWAVPSKGPSLSAMATFAPGGIGRAAAPGQGALIRARESGSGGIAGGEDAESVWRRITGEHAGESGVVPGERRTGGQGGPQGPGGHHREVPHLDRAPTFPPPVPRFRPGDGKSLMSQRSLKRGWSIPPGLDSTPPVPTPVVPSGEQQIPGTTLVSMELDPQAPWAPRPSRPFKLELGELTRGADTMRHAGLEDVPQRGRKRTAHHPLLRTQSDPAHLLNPYGSGDGLPSDSMGPTRNGPSRLSTLERQRSVPALRGGSLLRQTSAPEVEASQFLSEQILLALQRDGGDVGLPRQGGVSKKPKLTPRQMQTILDRQQRLLDSLPPEAWNTARLEPVDEYEELEGGRDLTEGREHVESGGIGGREGPTGQLAELEEAVASGRLSEDGAQLAGVCGHLPDGRIQVSNGCGQLLDSYGQLALDPRLLPQDYRQLGDEGGGATSSGRDVGAGNGHLVDDLRQLSDPWAAPQPQQQPRPDTWAKLERRREIMGEWDAYAKKRDALRQIAANRSALQRTRVARGHMPSEIDALGVYPSSFAPGNELAPAVLPGMTPESHLRIALRAMGEFAPDPQDGATDFRQQGGRFERGSTPYQEAMLLNEQSAGAALQEDTRAGAFSYQQPPRQAFQRITVPELPGGYSALPCAPNKSIVVPVGPQLASVLEIFQSAPRVDSAQGGGMPQPRPVQAPPPIHDPLLYSSNYPLPSSGNWVPSEALADAYLSDSLLDGSWDD